MSAPYLSLSNAYTNCNHHRPLFSCIRAFEAWLIPGYIPSVTDTKALVFICSQRWNINYSAEWLGQNKLSMDGTKKYATAANSQLWKYMSYKKLGLIIRMIFKYGLDLIICHC